VPEADKTEVLSQSEPRAYESKTLNNSKLKIPNSKVVNNSGPKTSKIQILKRPEPKYQVLMNSKFGVLKSKDQRRKTIVATWDLRPNGVKPKVLNEPKHHKFRHKAQKKTKTFRTNPKRPIKIWVPKSKTVNVAYLLKRKGKTEIMVPGQWLLVTHDRRKFYVPNLDYERGRNCGIWRKQDRQGSWYGNYW